MTRWVMRCLVVSLSAVLSAPAALAASEAAQSSEAPASIEELTEQLAAFRIESLASADRRAVLSLGEDLFLVRPGDRLPGIGWNRVVSVHPDRVLVAVPNSRTAVVIAQPDGRQRIEWLDANLPLSPPLQQPIFWALEPESTDPEVKLRRVSDVRKQVQDQVQEETP